MKSLLKNIYSMARKVVEAKPISIALGAIALFAGYGLTLVVPTGWLTYFVLVPAAAIVLVTCVARLNDIKPDQKEKRWHVRGVGFILAGTGAVTFLTVPFTEPSLFPSWKSVILMWGLALTWLTTPNMPPWWKYITGEFRQKDIEDATI